MTLHNKRPSTQDDSSKGRHIYVLIVAASLVLGLALRLINLGSQALWLDEASSADNVDLLRERGMAALAQSDHLPPLSFVLQAISTAHAMNEVTLRLPSVVAGVLAILFVHLTAVRITGSRAVGAWASAFMSVSPFMVWYSQDARMYSLLILLSVVYVWVCWPMLEKGLSYRRALGILVVTAAGLYTHHYFALLMVVMGVWLCLRLTFRSPALWMWVCSQVLASVAFVPWLVVSMTRASAGAGFEKAGEVLWLPYTFYSFIAGLTLGPSTADIRVLPVREWIGVHWLALALPVLAAAALSVALAKVHRRMARESLPWLLWWLTGTPLIAFTLSLTVGMGYNARYAATAIPALAILVGCALKEVGTNIWSRVAAGLLSVTICWSLLNWYTNPHYAKEDVRGVQAFVMENVAPSDRMLVYSHTSTVPLRHYGWTCRPGDLIIRGPAGATDVVEALETEPVFGRTWVLQYRPWETDQGGTLAAALTQAGAHTFAEWPGVSIQSVDRLVQVQPSEEIELCLG